MENELFALAANCLTNDLGLGLRPVQYHVRVLQCLRVIYLFKYCLRLYYTTSR